MKSSRWLFLFIGMLLFVTLACRGGQEPAPTVAVVATVPALEARPLDGAAETAVAEGVDNAGGDGLTFSTAYNFDSYRYQFVIELNGAEETIGSQRMEMTVSTTSNPNAQSAVIMAEGVDELTQFGTMSFTRVDSTSYIVAPTLGCIVNQGEGDNVGEQLFDDLANPSQFIDRLTNANLEGSETINGVSTNHYSFDETLFESQGEIDSAEGHIYVAQEGGYVVRFSIDGVGNLGFLDSEVNERGDFTINYDLLSVNNPDIEVVIPTDCEEQS